MSDHTDEICNLSSNEHFADVLARSQQAGFSRRQLIQGGVGLAAISSLPLLAACGGGDGVAPISPVEPTARALSFSAIDKSLVDSVILPVGYTYTVLHATGDTIDPLTPAHTNLGTETDDWSNRIGDHHDGMDIFFIDALGNYTTQDTGRAVLAVNHESSADAHFFHARGQTTNGVDGKKFSQFGGWDLGTRLESEVLKEINHHGISLVEVNRSSSGAWSYSANSAYNRRINGQTVMRIAGPSAQLNDIRSFMATKYDPSGATSRGTLNNCGHGKTPWGTYLGCEENWAAYFFMPTGSVVVSPKIVASRARYGVARTPLASTATSAGSQGWSAVASAATDDRFGRWNVSAPGATPADDFRNEPNSFGYNVEIDPLRPTAQPAKRVAMGRFAHEAAVCGIPVVGQPLAFYMGCDSRNEYIYKFVSTAVWDPADVGSGMAAGDKYLNEGKLYVARFSDNGTGAWIELNKASVDALSPAYTAYTFDSQADVLVNARHAASALGATRMDRPEWGAVNPKNGEVYFCLTNNRLSNRGVMATDAANPRAFRDSDGNAGTGNPNGHIIRFKEGTGGSTATAFNWDIFLFGAEEDAGAGINLSGLTAKNDFSSPDGLWFSQATGICWIQTDDGAYGDVTNNMLLAAIPGSVGDGSAIVVNNSLDGVTKATPTFIGAALGEAKLRRFLTGPVGSEITGLTESPDGRAIFVNIQHPGEDTLALGAAANFDHTSQWPSNAGYGPGQRPRSATIVIRRNDGGVIGA